MTTNNRTEETGQFSIAPDAQERREAAGAAIMACVNREVTVPRSMLRNLPECVNLAEATFDKIVESLHFATARSGGERLYGLPGPSSSYRDFRGGR